MPLSQSCCELFLSKPYSETKTTKNKIGNYSKSTVIVICFLQTAAPLGLMTNSLIQDKYPESQRPSNASIDRERSRCSPFRPEFSPFRPQIRPLRPQISPLSSDFESVLAVSQSALSGHRSALSGLELILPALKSALSGSPSALFDLSISN